MIKRKVLKIFRINVAMKTGKNSYIGHPSYTMKPTRERTVQISNKI